MISCGDQLLWNSSCLPGNDQLWRPTSLELFMSASRLCSAVVTNFFGTLYICQVMISWQTIYFETLHVCQVMISCGDQLLWNSSCLPSTLTISWQTIYFNFFGTLLVCQVIISWQIIYFKYTSCLPGTLMISWQTICLSSFCSCQISFNADPDPAF